LLNNLGLTDIDSSGIVISFVTGRCIDHPAISN